MDRIDERPFSHDDGQPKEPIKLPKLLPDSLSASLCSNTDELQNIRNTKNKQSAKSESMRSVLNKTLVSFKFKHKIISKEVMRNNKF
jgi:hypothetical protein